jgi:hypothetical protein
MRKKVVTILVITMAFLCTCRKNEQNYLDGHYIPEDLDDCFAELERILGSEDITKLKNTAEDKLHRYHYSIGKSLRNKWGLWKGSRLSEWFQEKGINHPDDMSDIIIVSYWRHLNSRPVRLNEQIEYYKAYRKQKEQSEKARTANENQPNR